MPGRGVANESKSFISVGEYVGSFAPVVLSVAADRRSCLSVNVVASLPKCLSLLSQQTHHHQLGRLLLCAPSLVPPGWAQWFFELCSVETGS